MALSLEPNLHTWLRCLTRPVIHMPPALREAVWRHTVQELTAGDDDARLLLLGIALNMRNGFLHAHQEELERLILEIEEAFKSSMAVAVLADVTLPRPDLLAWAVRQAQDIPAEPLRALALRRLARHL